MEMLSYARSHEVPPSLLRLRLGFERKPRSSGWVSLTAEVPVSRLGA